MAVKWPKTLPTACEALVILSWIVDILYSPLRKPEATEIVLRPIWPWQTLIYKSIIVRDNSSKNGAIF